MEDMSLSERFADEARALGYEIGLVNADKVRGARTIDRGEPFSFMHQPIFFATRKNSKWTLNLLPDEGQISYDFDDLEESEALEVLARYI